MKHVVFNNHKNDNARIFWNGILKYNLFVVPHLAVILNYKQIFFKILLRNNEKFVQKSRVFPLTSFECKNLFISVFRTDVLTLFDLSCRFFGIFILINHVLLHMFHQQNEFTNIISLNKWIFLHCCH